MADYRRPGVYVQERLTSNASIQSATSATLFVGASNRGPIDDPVRLESWSDYVQNFGGFDLVADEQVTPSYFLSYLPYAVYSYFQNGGRPAYAQRAVGAAVATASSIDVPSEASYVVTNKAWEANVATLTFASHSFEVNDRITVAISDDPEAPDDFDGTFLVTAADATTVSYALDVEGIGGTNEVQTLAVDATGGTFTITYAGQTTSAIDANSTAAVVKAALNALSNIGDNDILTVVRSGSANAYTYTITFDEALGATNIAQITASGASLTGGAGTATPGTTTPGAAYTAAVATPESVVSGPDHDNLSFTISTLDVGKWSNFSFAVSPDTDKGLAVTVEQDSYEDSLYTISVYLDGVVVERFVNLTTSLIVPNGVKSVTDAINDLRVGSQFITITDYTADTSPIQIDYPVKGTTTDDPGTTHYSFSGAFAGGTNPSLPDDTALTEAAQEAVSKLQTPLMVNIPGYLNTPSLTDTSTYTSALVSSSTFTGRDDVFIINDAVGPRLAGESSASYANIVKQAGTALGSFSGDSRVAAYTPWVEIPSPTQAGKTVLTPPGGAVAGTISRIDATIGVFRAPAGLIANLSNVVNVNTNYTDTQQGDLNDANINVIRPMAGSGISIMGARTRKRYDVDRYVSGRRTLIYVTESLRQSTQFALFENNSERLWTQLKLSTEQFLRVLWEGGGLRGETADAAFYVKCDSSINTPAVIARGEVRLEVGLALEYPAEFVVITISQYERGGDTNTLV